MICGDIIADVGSDHAYLPIWLYQNNKIKKAYALDMSKNCVNRAEANIKKYNISQDIIIPVLSDGLSCFDIDSEYDFDELTDIVIAGMGARNITEIIEQTFSLFPCRDDLRSSAGEHSSPLQFILQPASKADYLREFLHDNNFEIVQDIIVECKKRRYTIINARLKLN